MAGTEQLPPEGPESPLPNVALKIAARLGTPSGGTERADLVAEAKRCPDATRAWPA
jgi:hypothetical protein